MDDAARALLQAAWGLGDVRAEPLLAGHANSSFLLHGAPASCVARVSWIGKTAAQVDREMHALARARGRLGEVLVPTPVPTRAGAPGARTADGRWLHVFERIDGEAGVPANGAGAECALRALAALHAALAGSGSGSGSGSGADAPGAGGTPVRWLAQRHRRIRRRPAPPLASIPDAARDATLARIGGLLAAAPAWLRGPVQWLHGDYHAGNLLFAGDTLRGIVDFDEVGAGSAWLEAAFAAFALCRDAGRDDGFHFDAARWQEAVIAYADAAPGADARWWIAHRDALATLFCLDQVLIHLEAAQRGLWAPGPSMGFLGCWHALQAIA